MEPEQSDRGWYLPPFPPPTPPPPSVELLDLPDDVLRHILENVPPQNRTDIRGTCGVFRKIAAWISPLSYLPARIWTVILDQLLRREMWRLKWTSARLRMVVSMEEHKTCCPSRPYRRSERFQSDMNFDRLPFDILRLILVSLILILV